MAHRVGIVGASGYGGAELIRLLAAHPAIEVARIAANSHAGTEVGRLYPNLPDAGSFGEVDVDALGELDLVFLATPHEPAAELGSHLAEAGVAVVDLSAAFRLPAAQLDAWYGFTHPAPRVLDAAVYGLTEWAREDVRTARVVANPGCYPTAALLALLPVAGMVRPGSIVIDAKSGTSGAGRGVSDRLHHPHVDGSVSAYGAPSHRHTVEIEHALGVEVGPVSFTPHLVPMARGLLATCYVELTDGIAADDVVGVLRDRYADEPFVRVLEPGMFPHTKALAGSNGCQVSATPDPRTGRLLLVCAIDNLGKGAAGQAVQNANLVLGLDETTGLTATGIYP